MTPTYPILCMDVCMYVCMYVCTNTIPLHAEVYNYKAFDFDLYIFSRPHKIIVSPPII